MKMTDGHLLIISGHLKNNLKNTTHNRVVFFTYRAVQAIRFIV